MTLKTSPERNTFLMNSYLKRCEERGESPIDTVLQSYEDLANSVKMKEQAESFSENNLEYDLRNSDYIYQKCIESELYCQHLYAALCNNDFLQINSINILEDKVWHCSWRSAGGIVADIIQKGDYIDWYCSGMGGIYGDDILPGETSLKVVEGTVTDEIKEDLKKIGWFVKEI